MLLLLFLLISCAAGFKFPSSCNSSQFYDSTEMDCRSCNTNNSMVPSVDGFGCICSYGSIPIAVSRCKPCNSTELISEDGTSCVPRRCQRSGDRLVCRKCPGDYIAVTQNFDGSPMKEVTCVKCAKGYKGKNNKCVKCEACSCSKSEIFVNGKCLPKEYVTARPKYNDHKLHPSSLLDIVKLEYLCMQSDLRSCHALAAECVMNFYSSNPGGPCRLWIQPNTTSLKSLPKLVLNENNKNNVMDVTRGKATVQIAAIEHSSTGALSLLQVNGHRMSPCLPPLSIKIGEDYALDCIRNVSDLVLNGAFEKTYELFIPDQHFKPLTIHLREPGGRYVEKGPWPSGKFRKFFLLDNLISTTSNMTTTVYLRKLIFILRVERMQSGSLSVHISIETHYATKSPISREITTTLVVKHEMLSAGVLWGLEVCGGSFSALLGLYALVQWRSVVRRGGFQFSILPLLAGCIADGLYFATFLSTVHALAAEAGTTGITLPLSLTEENAIKAIITAVTILKVTRVAWMNWKQCRCDIFFIDWFEHNPPMRDSSKIINNYNWRSVLLAREWMEMQTMRRTCPVATITFTLVILQILEPWRSCVPKSEGYTWVMGSLSWWMSYTLIFSANWLKYRIFGSPTATLAKVCCGLDVSLLVFQEEYYAHYLHGRNEESDGSMKIPGALASCRVVCAPQVRFVYKKLASTQNGLCDNESNRILLSRFLAAFFERTLDGLNSVAIERTAIERLLDIELSNREGSNTSTLLYDPDSTSPSCFCVTWWGEEWTLATFDAMLFGSILLITGNMLVAALVTLILWQLMKQVREWFAQRNLRNKTDVEVF